MRSLFEKKPLVIILAVLALGALTVLSVSLRNVSFNDAQPIGREQAQPITGPPQGLFEPLSDEAVQSQIIVWVALGVLFLLITLLLSPEARRRMLRILFRMAFTLWAIYFIMKRYPEILSFLNFGFNRNAAADQNNPNSAEIAPPVFTPPQETPWLSYLISLLVILAALYLVWRLFRMWRDLNPGGKRPLEEIARVARASLRDLSDGRESTDVILNCYFRMSDVVGMKRNIRRESAMTPGEFALRLEQAGLPGDAVNRLTHLFERVRYGSQKAGPKETNEAVACLTTILQYCGEPV